MALVQIDNLTPGMILKRSVQDRSGRMLLQEGSVLEARHFGIFRMWGVLEVEVTVAAEPEPELPPQEGEIDPCLLAEVGEEVRTLFAHNDPEHPAIKELIRICVMRRADREA